jgi:acyl carrier protein
MSNKDKYDNVFLESFSISADMLNDDLVYQSISAWDSVGHMGMIAGLEEVFDIMLETDDIIEFSSYKVGTEILKKYGVEI